MKHCHKHIHDLSPGLVCWDDDAFCRHHTTNQALIECHPAADGRFKTQYHWRLSPSWYLNASIPVPIAQTIPPATLIPSLSLHFRCHLCFCFWSSSSHTTIVRRLDGSWELVAFWSSPASIVSHLNGISMWTGELSTGRQFGWWCSLFISVAMGGRVLLLGENSGGARLWVGGLCLCQTVYVS